MDAVGLLEVYGCCAAFVAADAASKAANVTVEALDKNKPANAEKLPVPLIMIVKIRGSVADVEAAMNAAEVAAKNLTGVVSRHIIPNATEDTEKLLKLSAI